MSTLRAQWPFLLALGLALILGFLAGRVVTLVSLQRTPIEVRDDERPSIPTVRIDGTQNGGIVGTVEGEARVFAGDEPVIVNEGAFWIPLSSLSGS